MLPVEPGREVARYPFAGFVHWRVERQHDAAFLPRLRAPIPGGDKAHLTLGEFSHFIKAVKVVGSALVIFLVIFVLHGREANGRASIEFPAM